ncbi:porin [Paeniroseomonas aquatica]|uniref:Porin n=1 Tax=Paeniroseomonas aquatica TaxID=373043 RepID=A0ABT8AEN2_9PROT|nr:porin [Paeniroseomonas aquatica]MDN3568120.1 porin [Paeniroseomonas aquatica]
MAKKVFQASGLLGGLVLAAAAPMPAMAQDGARMESIERQLRALQSELTRLRRDAATREAETRAARQEAERTRAEVQETRRRLDTAPAAPVVAAAPAPDAGRLTFPANRPTLTSADGRFSASLGGQFQYDLGGYLRDSPGTPNNRGVRDLDTFGQNLRRGRLLFGFRYDDFTLNVTPDFGGSPDGTVGLYEANFNWNPVKPLTLTLGYFKPWVTLGDSMSSNDFLFLERPSIVEIARNVAGGDGRASAGARWAADRYFLSAYFTGGSYGGNATQSTPDQTGGVARIAGRPVANADMDVHLGFSGSYASDIRRSSAGQTLQLRDRPELRIDQSRLIDTGAIAADRAYTYGPEFGVRWRNFMLQGEYIKIGMEQSQAGAAPRPDLGFEGGYVEGSWVLTGETRRYSSTSGAFGRPSPRQPFSLAEGGWGAWEVMGRYSVADLNDKVRRGSAASTTGGVYGGRQEVVGVGLSWYPNNLLRFMLNWDMVNVDRLNPAGTTQIGQRFHTIALRSQLAF